ncbi:MAG: ribosome biogenesis GTP-binding protein YihA/YsxC [Desulfatitalea sp.]
MIIKSSEFVTSAVKPAQYPLPEHPEIAFAGRSNVGKSSLINTLVNRKRLVRTSTTPGRTQLINFFIINANLMLVDLPGFGYAKVPAAIKKQWGPMVETYLSGRPSLKAVVLLIDLRRTPGVEELGFMDWLQQYGVVAVPVLTKADKLSKTNQIKQRKAIAQALERSVDSLILFSAKTGQGKETLWQHLESILGKSDGSESKNG